MTSAEILEQLSALSEEPYKKILLKHGVKEPLYGVKIEHLQKIRKQVKSGHDLALELYATGIYDAMYLAGLMAEPVNMAPGQLQQWAEQATSPVLREYTVTWVAAESGHGLQKAQEWINTAGLEDIGWATLASIVTITDDSALDMPLLAKLLQQVAATINTSRNRVKAAMNTFMTAAGIHVQELSALARQTATEIGKVKIDVGDTACKVPYAPEYIDKAAAKGGIGKKKKSARCL